MAVFKDSTEKPIQHIYGLISADGQILSGEGFKARRIWVGTYLVEYEHPFSNTPAAVCTINGSEWQTFDKSVAVVESGQSHFIYVTSSPDSPEDCAISFITLGQL